MARSIAEAQVLGEVFEFTQMLDVHVHAFPFFRSSLRVRNVLVNQRVSERVSLFPIEKHKRESASVE